jgi:hypothetical protein
MADPTPVVAKTYLLAALRTALDAAGLADVETAWAHPGKNIKRESAYFGDTQPYTQQGKSLGNGVRDESYSLELVVTVQRRGNDAEAAERRCWEILAVVHALLKTDDTLGDEVRVAEYRTGPVRNYTGAQERVSESVVTIDVEAEV